MRAESDARRHRSGLVGGGGAVVVVVEEEEGGQGVARIASVEVAGSLTGEGGTHPN